MPLAKYRHVAFLSQKMSSMFCWRYLWVMQLMP